VLLVLFDVDGTLFLSHDPLAQEATLDAIDEVYGLRIEGDPMADVAHAGRTARWITGEILRRAGLDETRIQDGLDAWCEAVSRSYLRLLESADLSGWETPPGTAQALARLRGFARIALLTGNPEPIARARMERLELADFFPPGAGAFGCEGDERPELIALARQRAGDWPAERTIEVGDTPQDVSGAHAAGARSVAVCWARFTRAQLAGADAFIDSMAQLPDTVASLDSPP
jgi:phosphoglycolate phosphatase-like HAD superfamily hydrolase